MSRFSLGSYGLALFLSLPMVCGAQPKTSGEVRASLSGRVSIEGDNVGASQVRVDLKLLAESGTVTAFTDRDGVFRIANLLQGRYLISINVPGCVAFEETRDVDYATPPMALRLRRNNPANPTGVSRSVSVHALSIPEKAIGFFQKGNRFMVAGNFSASVSQYRRAIKSFPDFYEANYMLGLAELNQKHGAGAEAAFRESIASSQHRYPQPWSGLSLVLCLEQRFAEAEAAARENLNLDPTDATGHYALGLVLFATGRLADAENQVLDAVHYRPRMNQSYLLLAQIHQRLGNPAGVVADLDTYLDLAPDSPSSAKARAERAEAQNTLLQRLTSVQPFPSPIADARP